MFLYFILSNLLKKLDNLQEVDYTFSKENNKSVNFYFIT
ncbi:hypothetical protein BX659_1449 [Orenia metallireducens]|uniref:Uncharacterized protein n=1 Tax=Orenia metallireducens TaxID=1413210 RepID=A0A285IFQ3_9FIRM|nr:hypothetical protein BX659_1449 [Orenia metallireducens]SNY46798.1 hypothetical protein SAMN06265827_1459 [Orenia metallireducens]